MYTYVQSTLHESWIEIRPGLISVQQIAKDPLLDDVLAGSSILKANNAKATTKVLTKEFKNKGNSSGYLSVVPTDIGNTSARKWISL